MTKNQESFFDKEQNQYLASRIINPPLHTKLEIANILNLLKNKKISAIVGTDILHHINHINIDAYFSVFYNSLLTGRLKKG
ncbi:MAG: hypothetical protein A3D75_03340 [Candidatus Levybacteria bacterium RIFCSPHIGHO2_02_FULL_37_18]|nr:MAG: hypothetical protein A2770_01810 [Candidatus Levybacteria bacterium RIFCSPHIGHO2_01_FULL_38_12]OGH22032.1 MAG: hypothetical protein A3D75_03340 [Candidatus Levybacteria bacterium RIFCSPHIGHO2_02_FULL_37_18]OGH33725.1 MAG: hypothetical protein A3A47_02775 [Candidatus Levybacteria bacterium RIFCSPLOWO2_01_FULL_37_20]OGH44631.1 MAG: hypothetical protein A3J14_00860 [Candidatus Levybacteria bacterium RIFCSPLOWO2_02_FULL_37_18]